MNNCPTKQNLQDYYNNQVAAVKVGWGGPAFVGHAKKMLDEHTCKLCAPQALTEYPEAERKDLQA